MFGAIIGEGQVGASAAVTNPEPTNREGGEGGFGGGIREETDSSIILTSNRPGNSVDIHARGDSQIPV